MPIIGDDVRDANSLLSILDDALVEIGCLGALNFDKNAPEAGVFFTCLLHMKVQ